MSHILSERFSNKSCEGKLDWGIFEKQDPNFDGASGTQILIHKAAQLRNLRLNSKLESMSNKNSTTT